MRITFLLSAFTFFSSLLYSQNITGIWRGGFHSGAGSFAQLQYKYEVQINQMKNAGKQKGLEGVTYSYQSTAFYGKALLQGIYDPKEHAITIKETRLVELKIGQGSVPCLMTCYLDYHREGKKEILSGTYSSVMVSNKQDCGSGYVYLEKVAKSAFHKEDFLVKKRPPVFVPPSTKAKPPITKTPKNTPGKISPEVEKEKERTETTNLPKIDSNREPSVPGKPDLIKEESAKKPTPIPEEIKRRENPLIRTIVTSSPLIQIQLFDNGEIDGDTITVYHNNKVIAYKKGLSKTPITLHIRADEADGINEFIMVANNLGSIPPNTALMVITTGGKRYELFVSSDEKKNAKVVINYNGN